MTFSAPAAFGAAVLPLWPRLQDCDAKPRDGSFAGRTASILLPGMSVMAASFTSLRVSVSDNTRTSVAFQLQGNNRLRIQNRTLELNGTRCLFVPVGSGPQEAVGQDQNVLMMQIDPQALHAAARALRGLEPDHPVDLDCGHARFLTAATGPSLEALARHIGATINLHADHIHLLHQLGFQDFVYRQLVLLFRPDWLTAAPPLPRAGSLRERRAIDRVCDAMLADPGARFTIGGLAELGGLSVRALQYAFQSRFGQSPMQWLRDQRLDHARRLLLQGSAQSIAQIALGCGFATASSFSAFYRERYGESPAQTRARGL
ncbi:MULTISPECIES: AraC family transcriptional regulator [unclassified Acidovorax]|uniref:AraC family transcriptional regulator n=1 Tax=unclassified Acidovorax TaxID=2684926 RepID=UPI0012E1A5D8|nr:MULTISPECIES: helix-turn-helix domain-containing protein [unclassified Acidovorax]